jgi:hypothetical protein
MIWIPLKVNIIRKNIILIKTWHTFVCYFDILPLKVEALPDNKCYITCKIFTAATGIRVYVKHDIITCFITRGIRIHDSASKGIVGYSWISRTAGQKTIGFRIKCAAGAVKSFVVH